MVFYRRNLPHWHPQGKSFFVTWRLHGSLPKQVMDDAWPTSRRPVATATSDDPFPNSNFLAVDSRLDQALHGPVRLHDHRIAAMVVESLHYGENELGLYSLGAFMVMSNHVHVLWTPRFPLERITRRLKSYTSLKANRLLNRSGCMFWQEESFDHWIRSERQFAQVVHYIENNPVKAGLVHKPEDWPWSSASR